MPFILLYKKGGGGSRRDPNHKSMYKCAYMYVHLSLKVQPTGEDVKLIKTHTLRHFLHIPRYLQQLVTLKSHLTYLLNLLPSKTGVRTRFVINKTTLIKG